MPRLALPLALLTLAPALLAAPPGKVWTVGGSSPDFAEIQPAVSAASGGDLILVRPGSYAQFAIFDTSLTVVAETPGSVQISGQVRVANLAAGRRVALIDLSVTGNDQSALYLLDNEGSVRVRGGTWIGTDYATPWWQAIGAAIRVHNCEDVSLRSITARGGRGLDAVKTPIAPAVSGGAGIDILQSNVTVHHSTLTGGNGGSDLVEEGYDGGYGGDGIGMRGGFLHVVNSTLRGGDGGRGGDESGCVPFGIYAGNGGHGGSGLALRGGFDNYGPAEAQVMALVGVGGSGGTGGWGYCGPDGDPGQAGLPTKLIGQASSNTLPGPVRRFLADGLWRPGQPETLTFKGQPGEDVYLVLSPQAGFIPMPAKQGVLLLGGMPALQYAGRLDAAGTLTRTFTPVALPPGWDGQTILRQAWMTRPGSPSTLTGPLTTALIDPAF